MRRFLISYIIIILIISLIHFILVNRILNQSEENNRQQEYSQLNYNAEFLRQQTAQNINTLISEIRLLSVPYKNQSEDVQKLLTRRKELFHINYFSADGNLKYSSKKAALEWQSNLLNSDWYRSLIKNWQVTVTNIHKSPVSPFPQVIAIAIPVSVKQTIDGFWLAYLDIRYTGPLFTTMQNKLKEIASVWFDNNGEILKLSAANKHITEAYIKSNGWWYKINESDSNAVLSGYKQARQFLFNTNKVTFENLQVLVVRDVDNALRLYYNFKSNIIILSVILQLLLMVIVAVIVRQLQKQRAQLTELFNVNNLLEAKSQALITTNEKLDKLVNELDEQKKQLIMAKNNLERVQKYLNFLTLPVIALNKDYNFEFVNRAAEMEFNCALEKLHNKPFDTFIHIKNKQEFLGILENAQKDIKRKETTLVIQTENSIKNFMVSCDYLSLSDWHGFIVTFSDLTELLQLQDNIKTQNTFLEKTSRLTELFLLPRSETEILTEALAVLKQYLDSKGILFYQNENNSLLLKAFLTDKKMDLPQALSAQSIAAGTITSGEPVIIKSKADIPVNVNPPEKQFDFQKALFYPVILDNRSTGVVIVLDPRDDIVNDSEHTVQNLLMHFKIGLSAQGSRKKLEMAKNELEQSAILRAQLLRSITHGLKTPLSTIKGYVKLIQLKFLSFLEEKPELFKFIQKLDNATADMDDKIMMYLDMARINRNDLHFDNIKISLDDLIRPVEQALASEAEIKEITLECPDRDSKKVNIVADPKRMEFALKTIFVNALKYAPQEDTVSLHYMQEKDTVLVHFEDHGQQINKENIPLIGMEFLPEEVKKERLHYADSLAMALAVKIIELAGGKLIVNSSKEKTVHSIQLPLI